MPHCPAELSDCVSDDLQLCASVADAAHHLQTLFQHHVLHVVHA